MKFAAMHGAAVVVDADHWRVEGDVMCKVKAQAATLPALCAAVEAESAKVLGVAVKCEAGKPLGVGVDPAMAVRDAAVLQVIELNDKGTHYSLFAVDTQKGWQVVRNTGSVTPTSPTEVASIELVSASPVDVPGLEPVAVQARVALIEGDHRSERVFVCGVSGDGKMHCPLAAVVADGLAASGDTTTSGGWRVALELGAQGYVAKLASGDIPATMRGLLGEHGWGEQAATR